MKIVLALLTILAMVIVGCSPKPQGDSQSTAQNVDVVGTWTATGTDAKPGYKAEFKADGSFSMLQGAGSTSGKYTVTGNHVGLMIEELNGMSVPTSGTPNSRGLDVEADGKTMSDSGGTGSLIWHKQ